MKAVILAAGRGSRIKPLSDNMPKSLLKINGKSILQTNIDTIKSCGIDDIVIVKGYKAELINFPGIRYYVNENFKHTEQLVSFFCAKNEMDKPFLLLFGDVLFRKSVLSGLIKKEGDIVLAVDTCWKEIYKNKRGYDLDRIRGQDLLWGENSQINKIGNCLNIQNFETHAFEAFAEWVGLAKFSKKGAELCADMYNNLLESGDGFTFQGEITIACAKIINLLQELIVRNQKLTYFDIKNPDKWKEINTLKDLKIAETWSNK